jgi:hypothetical protein
MKRWMNNAMLVTLIVWGTIPSSAQKSPPSGTERSGVSATSAGDNMATYRTLATDTLQAFKAHDMSTAKKKARELEKAWDSGEKALKKKSPDLWEQIDQAMDAFIKPLQGKSPDPAKVQAAYDTFIAKLQMAVNSVEPKP